MVRCDGMKTMNHRTTFALDEGTVGRLKRLSGAWRVSQAEVLRRAIALADREAQAEIDTTAALRAIHKSGKLLVREEAEKYLVTVYENRRSWRGDE